MRILFIFQKLLGFKSQTDIKNLFHTENDTRLAAKSNMRKKISPNGVNKGTEVIKRVEKSKAQIEAIKTKDVIHDLSLGQDHFYHSNMQNFFN